MLNSCTIRLPPMWTNASLMNWLDPTWKVIHLGAWASSKEIYYVLWVVTKSQERLLMTLQHDLFYKLFYWKKNLIEKKENRIVGRWANEHNENKTMVKKIVIWIIYCLLFLLSFPLRLRPTRTRALCFLCSRAFVSLQINLKGRRNAAKLTAREESDGSVIDSAKDRRKIEQWVTV